MIPYTLLEFDQLNSTSDFLKENFSYFPHMTFIRANFQTQGRGQFDRTWLSDSKQNILCSILLKDLKMSSISEVKLWMKESLMSFLENEGLNPRFKEPNDIYIFEQKICGILIETKSTSDHLDYVIVGFGLNVNQHIFHDLYATSMSLLKDQDYDIQKLFQRILNHLVYTYEDYDI
ncbi:MAG: biotin--[acetyl-CoA-carboxylase] ligase [Tenericutes bacterium HGW-Tenericutes-6]|nr:MAG: biotin--[acetyl-CoA-carboxylase] ligase [Tenericutes bacterium HGW-Tenericutes-6]